MISRDTVAKRRPRKAVAGATPPASLDQTSLMQALRTLMQPLAALSVARGMSFRAVDEMLKTAFVDNARTAHANAAPHRMVSRISTVTGLNRREVSRLLQADRGPIPIRDSPATQVFTRWISEPALKNGKGKPVALPRQGPAPSFEELARSVSRDVHPRSLLEELARLGLVRIEGDTVHVVRDSFVPKHDIDRMLGFLGSNVGDHLRAAVANVISDPPEHLEQAVFADELSQESLDRVNEVMRLQWKALLQATVPLLNQLIAADGAAKRSQDRRVRVGMYMFSEPMAARAANPKEKAPARARKSAPKRRGK